MTTAMVAKPRGLHAVRFRLLLQQLTKETGGASRAGRLLGLKQSYSSMILNDERGASWDVITRAIELFPVAERFFTDPALGDAPDYRKHVESSSGQRRSMPSSLPSPPPGPTQGSERVSHDEREQWADGMISSAGIANADARRSIKSRLANLIKNGDARRLSPELVVLVIDAHLRHMRDGDQSSESQPATKRKRSTGALSEKRGRQSS